MKKISIKARKMSTSQLVVSAMIAAIYVALTLGLRPISYGPVQFRIAELLNLMAFISPLYGVGVTVGCVVSNLFSDLGMIDVVVGGASTAFAVFCISKTKSLFVASLWPTLFSGLMVGAELTYVFATPLLMNILSVAVGQFAVLTCVGYPLFKYILENKGLRERLRNFE